MLTFHPCEKVQNDCFTVVLKFLSVQVLDIESQDQTSKIFEYCIFVKLKN